MKTYWSEWLRTAMLESKRGKFSQYRLAKDSGVSQPTIGRILKGISREPERPTLLALAEAMGYILPIGDQSMGKASANDDKDYLPHEAMEMARRWHHLEPEFRRDVMRYLRVVEALDSEKKGHKSTKVKKTKPGM